MSMSMEAEQLCQRVKASILNDDVGAIMESERQYALLAKHPEADSWLVKAMKNSSLAVIRYMRAQHVKPLHLVEQLPAQSKLRKEYMSKGDTDRLLSVMALVRSAQPSRVRLGIALLCFEKEDLLRRHMPESTTFSVILHEKSPFLACWGNKPVLATLFYGTLI